MTVFKGAKLQVFKTYLDTWGRMVKIVGVSQGGYAYCMGNHYNPQTGRCLHGSRQLVQLPPLEEINYWKNRIAEIENANSKENLNLLCVKNGLENMRERIKELE